MMKNRFLFAGVLWGLALPLVYGQYVAPNVTNAEVTVQVSYDPITYVYTYNYTLSNSPQNIGNIQSFLVDIGVRNAPLPQPDLALLGDSSLRDNLAPDNSVPVGLQSPVSWSVAVTSGAEIFWSSERFVYDISPGNSLAGFKIYSKAPPGARSYTVEPFILTGPNTPYHEGCELEGSNCPSPVELYVHGQTVGPVPPEELKLINGKGQSAAVNAFLAYSNLTATRTTLPATAKGFDLAVKYGNTTLPSTFSATLNGVDVTASFRPNPGAFDVVRIPLVKGTNKLLLSIEGLKPSGAQSRDTDSLTFIVP